MMPVVSCTPIPFYTPCDNYLPCFFCATRWLYVHLYMLVYMFMHESCLLVCHPCFNTMRLWTSDPNLHLSLVDTTFCLLLLFYPLLVVCYLDCLLLCSHPVCYAYHYYLACSCCALLLLSMHLSLSIACLLVSCLYLCKYPHGVRTHGARARSPRHKQKGCGCKLANMSRAALFSRFRV